MNLAINETFDYNTIFINSGDEFSNFESLKYIKSNLKKNKCLIFQTKIINKCKEFFPKKNFFLSEKYMPHPSFVRPPVLKIKHKKYFNSNLKIAADGEWMKENIRLFGYKKIPILISNFYTGGFSTNPTFKSIKVQYDYNLKEGFKETAKFMLFKIFKSNYFNVIFNNKFYTK